MSRLKRMAAVLLGLGACLTLSGCARSVLNYQIAESIGTLGQYENNEPVETPKMKAEREQEESEAAVEEQLTSVLDEAESLAEQYEYEEAISLLQNSDISQEDERVTEAIAAYQEALDSMYEYEGDIGHLSFTNLIADTSLAFDGDGNEATYDSNMITLSDFQGILQQLYDNGYVLIDIHSLVEETQDENGNVTLTQKNPLVPQGKKPLILSVDNLNYSSVVNGDGIATRLTLNDQGEVQAVYTDSEGHDLTGAYDIVPVLNVFIQEHPDFSLGGARGIISLSGVNGAFGYDLSEETSASAQENQDTVRAIAQKLTEDGWQFACAGYSHSYMDAMSLEDLQSEIESWQEEVGTLVGGSDILFYPYGAEVEYPSEQLDYLTESGFVYLCGLWGDTDYMEIQENYMRQTRRFVDGSTLEYAPDYFTGFFSVGSILDPDR